MNKKTNWITIPDEKIHTPVSHSKTQNGVHIADAVQNKIFWGIGFIALIVVAFAMLAPNELNTLIQGNLFDAQGDPEQELGSLNLLPQKQGKTAFDEEGNAQSTEQTADNVENTSNNSIENSANNVVQPESEAVNISIEPIGPKDCGQDFDCFLESLKSCSAAKSQLDYSTEASNVSAVLEITGADNGQCLVNVGFASGPDISVEGKEAICEFNSAENHTKDSISGTLSNVESFEAQCSGEAVEAMKSYIDGLKTEETANEQAKIIEELNAQLEALAKKQQENLKGSAPEGINSSITSTNIIGQPPAQTPGFRTNPYRVSITPQQMLQQNLAGGVVAQNNPTNNNYSANMQGNYSNTNNHPLSGGQTPATGPAETLLAAIAMAYFGTMLWERKRRKRITQS